MLRRMTPTASANRRLEPATAAPTPDAATPGPAAPRALLKSEDWVAAWLGLAIIALVLVGVRPEIPKFKWATDSAVASTIVAKKAALDTLAMDAAALGEQQLATAASSLRAAAETGDRSAIGKAARDLGEAAKTTKDGSLKRKATELGKSLSDAGAFLAGVFSAKNLGAS